MIKGTKNKLITWLLNQEEDKVFEIKEYKNKRNNDQNSKYYKLLNELALVLKIGTEELHFNMLKRYSQRYQTLIPAEYELRGIKYFEELNRIRKNGSDFINYIVYVPSSELKENEFALLLQGLIEECQEQGIDTRSPEEILRDEALYEIHD
jgi:hypothetical protein